MQVLTRAFCWKECVVINFVIDAWFILSTEVSVE